MSGVAPNTFTGAIALMERLGARFATVIDVGSADGHFVVSHKALGLLKGAVPLNVDPLAIYEPSLQRVQADLGGAHRICARGDGDGEVESRPVPIRTGHRRGRRAMRTGIVCRARRKARCVSGGAASTTWSPRSA